MKAKSFAYSWIIVIVIFMNLAQTSNLIANTGKITDDSGSEAYRSANMKSQEPVIENLLESEPEGVYKGALLRAFLSAYESFRKDALIPVSKKAIENYQVQFRQNAEFYLVTFTIDEVHRSSAKVGGESDLTKSVYYVVNKKDLKVKSRKFFK
jgi:hypothetical protein